VRPADRPPPQEQRQVGGPLGQERQAKRQAQIAFVTKCRLDRSLRRTRSGLQIGHLNCLGLNPRASTSPHPALECLGGATAALLENPELASNGRQFVDAGHRQRPVSHGKPDALGRTRANVARRQNSRNRCFQWTWFAFA
jgi:hypothetical protein